MNKRREGSAREERAPAHGGAMSLRVECYAGHRGESTPRRIHLGARCVEAVEVVDRWLEPDHRYFKIRGDDGATYIVRHDVGTDRWELTMFDAGYSGGG